MRRCCLLCTVVHPVVHETILLCSKNTPCMDLTSIIRSLALDTSCRHAHGPLSTIHCLVSSASAH